MDNKQKVTIKVKDATKIYGEQTVLFKGICGFTRLSKGQIEVLGKIIGEDVDMAESVGAIIENPEILILDEPFNGMDKNGTKEIRELLLQMKEDGKTILLASHSAEDIEILCDEVYEMEMGVCTRRK